VPDQPSPPSPSPSPNSLWDGRDFRGNATWRIEVKP
jgi:hypothetical protein